jgi:hypothetical protein
MKRPGAPSFRPMPCNTTCTKLVGSAAVKALFSASSGRAMRGVGPLL